MKAFADMKSIVDTIEHQDWSIRGWKVNFLFSERQLYEVKKLSRVSNWYEDPIVADTWTVRLNTCFSSIQNFYNTFGVLPQVGDRLFDENSGMIIQDRAIDGHLMTITFTLSI